MLRILKPLLLIPFILAGLSCLTNPVDLGEHDDYMAQFDLVWRTFDQEYIGFIFLDIDWNAVYNQYRPKVDDIRSQQELMDILLDMLALLEDGHINIGTPDEEIIHPYVPDYEVNFDMEVIWSYIDSLSTGGFTFWDADSVWGYAMLDSIPYVMVRFMDPNLNFTHLSNLVENVPDAPAMIIDVRMNGGGVTTASENLAEMFCSERCLAYYWVCRNGPEHDDLSEPDPCYTNPLTICFDRPVIVLIGERSASATEHFALRAEVLPRVILAGDTTMREVNAPAIFDLAGGYSYTVTLWTILSADSSTWIQETGIAPDVYIPATAEDFAQGIDPVLDYALEWAVLQ